MAFKSQCWALAFAPMRPHAPSVRTLQVCLFTNYAIFDAPRAKTDPFDPSDQATTLDSKGLFQERRKVSSSLRLGTKRTRTLKDQGNWHILC